jgi:parallel beta-helix repeat protein
MLRVSKFLVLVVFAGVLLGSAQSVSAANIDNCSILNTAGETYNLTQDIPNSPNSTCMNIQADNVTLDCGGYIIDGVDSASSYGVYINNYDNITVRNCEITDWWDGVYMVSSSNGVVFNNNLTSNNDGLEMISSSYNNISYNLIDNLNDGIYLNASSFNSIGHNSIKNGDNGIRFYSVSSNNTLFRNTFETFNSYAVYVYQSYYNFFRDSNINSTSTNVYHFASTDTIFLNVSLDRSEITTDAGSVHMKWYLDVEVLTEGGSPINQANVIGKDKDNKTVFSELTNASGYIERQNITEFHQNFSGQFFYNNYSINVTRSGFSSNQTSVNITANKIVIISLESLLPPVVELKTYDLGLSEKEMFKPGRIVRIRAEVTHTSGKEYIRNSTVLIKNNLGSTVVNNELMSNVSEVTNGYLYEYNYTLPGNADGLWSISVTATDSFDMKGYDSKKIAVVSLTIQIKLVLNSTSDRIYIPGTGERAFSVLTTNEYTTPDNYYLASYSSDVLKSVVFSYMNPLSIFTEKGSDFYGIGTNQRFSNSMVFLVFSKGNWRNVNNRISSIEKGEFLSSIKPSFSYGLGKSYPFKILLEYDNIDMNKTLRIQRGFNRLIVEKKGMTGDKVNLEIRRD